LTSLREAARAARERLRAAGIDDPDIEAELLLRYAIEPDGGLTRAQLFARYQEPIAAGVASRYEALLERRLDHEPSAYITGHREFYGLDFVTTPAVLIPRPETETLVEAVVRHAREAAPPRLRIADIGTGSGAIAISLAGTLPAAEIYATDASREALAVAIANAERHEVARRVSFGVGHLLTALHDYVDVIVANLPYVTTAEWHRLPPELREHEPRLALDGGEDGLDLIRPLLRQAPRYLRGEAAAVFLEIGPEQESGIRDAVTRSLGDARLDFLPDMAARTRVAAIRYSNR
jgi:release factor glutamine methyltransferase